MTASEQLLNLTILEKLSQLEGRIPGFIENQLQAIDKQWGDDFSRLDALITSGNYTQSKELLHRMRGHLGMFGMSKLCALLEDLESKMPDHYQMSAWARDQKSLADIKKRSLEAAHFITSH